MKILAGLLAMGLAAAGAAYAEGASTATTTDLSVYGEVLEVREIVESTEVTGAGTDVTIETRLPAGTVEA